MVKFMLNFFILYLFLVSHQVFAQSVHVHDSRFDDTKDYLRLDFGKNNDNPLVKEVLFFKDKNLKGKPEIKLTIDGIIETGNSKLEKSLLDFLISDPQINMMYIKIDSCNNSICKATDNKSEYYFKMEKNYFKKNAFPKYTLWKKLTGITAKRKVEEIFFKDIFLKKKIQELSQCQRLKDFSCLARFFNVSEDGLTVKAHKNWVVRNVNCETISKNPYIYPRHWSMTSHQIQEIQSKILIPWNLFQKVNPRGADDEIITVQTRNFNEVDSIKIYIPGEKFCNGAYNTGLSLNFLKDENNSWQVNLGEFVLIEKISF